MHDSIATHDPTFGRCMNTAGEQSSHLAFIDVVYNPVARHGQASRMALSAHAWLTSHGIQHELHTTCARDDVRDQVRGIATRGAGSTVLVIAGDGTIHHVANALLELPRDERPVLAVAPAGSGNDIARSLGVHHSLEHALNVMMRGTVIDMDIARANDEYYLETFSFGLDAETAFEADRLARTRKRSGKALYVPAVVTALRRMKRMPDTLVSFDEADPVRIDPFLLAINNGRTYGGGVALTNEASIVDGRLDFAWVPRLPLHRLVRGIVSVLRETHASFEELTTGTLSTARIEHVDGSVIAYQLDGEKYEATSIDISVIPRELTVAIAPRALIDLT